MARFLSESHHFDTIYREASEPRTRRTKFYFISQALSDLVFLLKRLKTIRRYRYILALWHAAPAFMLLKRLRLIDYDKLLWFGFSVHTSFWARLYRWIVKLDPETTWFVVFTEQEIEDYSARLDVRRDRLMFIPHGDWPQPIEVPAVFSPDPDLDLETPFYFAGGFTNRDYKPVIDSFRRLGQRLIIVCSRTNVDVVDAELPANIQVFRDITFPEFELLLQACKAVIIPLKHDRGAAGHSVLVRSMRNAKIVIANDFRIVDDYIDNDVDGVLVEDMEQALERVVLQIEAGDERFERIRKAALARFQAHYSQAAMEQMMSDLVEGRRVRVEPAPAPAPSSQLGPAGQL
jgi:glycosyltransferase involved in cell wall biosynthesis